MRFLPVFLDLSSGGVVLVGFGEPAINKLRLLSAAGARVRWYIGAGDAALAQATAAELLIADIATTDPLAVDWSGVAAVFSAAGRPLDDAVAARARALRIPINVVDRPDLSSFIMPAIVDRAPVTVAIGTEGAAPVLAREIKSRIEALLPANFGVLAGRAQSLRKLVARTVPDARARRRLWERLLLGPFRRAVLSGAEAEAKSILGAELRGAGLSAAGRVALIGCGPGDPDLLTLKALQRLQEADVLVIDRLVNPQVLEYARRDAERIYVGKTPGGPTTSQAEINRILVREASAGKVVARLKGGDPLIFGRAAEEMAALQAAGIAVEVVPGVTAAHACAARVGLPVTLREHVRQFSVVTGATADAEPGLDWQALIAKGTAFAIYMGVGNAPLIRRNLLGAGARPETPVVIVENGTRESERAVATTLQDLTDCVAQLEIVGPAVIFVGLDWAEAGLERPGTVTTYCRQRQPARSSAHDAPTVEVEP